MSNYRYYLLFFVFAFSTAYSQSEVQELPESQLSPFVMETQLRFIASDELMGRRTGETGNNIAARYIAAHLKAFGYTSPEGAENYFQPVNLASLRSPQSGGLTLDGTSYTLGEDLILLDGVEKEINTTAVFANYGWVDEASGSNDYQGLDVKGKVVVVLSGLPDNNEPNAVFNAMSTKRKLAAERGAVGLVEVYTLSYPWRFFKNYFGRERIEIAEAEKPDELIYAWIQAADKSGIEQLKARQGLPVQLKSGNSSFRSMASQNVIGIMEGTDPELKDEYILLTAHYDHVGTGSRGGSGEQDTIFNGARDNGMGVVALLAAAESLAKQPPKRSVIILAVTGEEIGLLGSQYYAEHPLIPLEKTVFNINTDGAGYTVTDGLAVIGWDRTGTNKWVEMGSAKFGLEVITDPAKEQNLFDRSDNVSFARKGIPCVTISPGFKTFNQELMQFYHQVTDEADSVDYSYLEKYAKAFAHTARLIANGEQRPVWVAGDKYEEAGKELYGER